MTLKKLRIILIAALTTLFSMSIYSADSLKGNFQHPWYVGLTGGYGSTTWGQLQSTNLAMSLSTPIHVSEGGFAWGVHAGYEFLPQFAIETNYMHYQAARLYFDSISIFSFDYDGRTELTTSIETISIMAKLMLLIPNTPIRAFSGFGPAVVHRYDDIKNIWHVSPTFGARLNYNPHPNWMVEIGTNYIAGYGKAELDVSENFVPFLYSGFVRIAYRF